MSSRQTIGLFGSSQNPPTFIGGHYTIVEYFSRLFDQVWVLPVFKHPYESKRNLLPFEVRCKLANLTYQGLKNVHVKNYEKDAFDEFFQSHTEAERKKFGTIDLIYFLKRKFPQYTFKLILGLDALNDLKANLWKRGNEIPQLLELAVVKRKGYSLQMTELDPAVHIYELELGDISSTLARNCKDVDKLKTFVHPKVAEFILNNNLYSFDDPKDSRNRIWGEKKAPTKSPERN